MTRDPSVRITWSGQAVPDSLPVTQVYGWLLHDCRVMLQHRAHQGKYTLPGGRPEPGEQGDWYATLYRECVEESQVRVGRAVYLGHQVVIGDRTRPGPYAQVRMAAVVAVLDPIGPDPDKPAGTPPNRRLFTTIGRAPGLLHWGPTGYAQAAAVARVAPRLGVTLNHGLGDVYRDEGDPPMLRRTGEPGRAADPPACG